uniref:Uncharacterized protein n=1 Tax=Candidozyma auris TaxID=498019 RepID=A0A0L0P3X1_CANAR
MASSAFKSNTARNTNKIQKGLFLFLELENEKKNSQDITHLLWFHTSLLLFLPTPNAQFRIPKDRVRFSSAMHSGLLRSKP